MPPGAPDVPQGEEILIERIGHLGDGLASIPEGTIQVPYTAPGDRVVRDNGAWKIAHRGPNHVSPPCPHFGTCGGCSLQHVSADLYRASKREWVAAALARQGIEAPLMPMIMIAAQSRRRATFTIQKESGNATVGFQERRTRRIVAVPECRILRPCILSALDAITTLVGVRLKSGSTATVAVTEAENGSDVAVEGPSARALDAREISLARSAGIVRISWNGEALMSLEAPWLSFSGTRVEVPPGAFVQAAAEAERALVALVEAALPGVRSIADLYAGLGPFTFALARRARVFAFEGDAAGCECLARAARAAEGLKPVVVERRDLVRRPLLKGELAKFDAVVIDPPRAGAEAQARQLAGSRVSRIAYVSCDPASFARDARILIEGGYALLRVTPVDQFVWSHHVEFVGAFERV